MSTISPDMQIDNNQGTLTAGQVEFSQINTPLEPSKEGFAMPEITANKETILAPDYQYTVYGGLASLMPSIEVKLKQGKRLWAQVGSIATKTPNIEVNASTRGGGFRRMLSGENLFINEITPRGKDGEVILNPDKTGQVIAVKMGKDGADKLICKAQSHLFHEDGVTMTGRYVGSLPKAFFGGMGVFHQEVEGEGYLALQSEGQAYPKYLEPGEELLVDQGFILAYSPDLTYKLSITEGGPTNWMFSGQGLFMGKLTAGKDGGVVWLQSKKESVEKRAEQIAMQSGSYSSSSHNSN
jgi:uncharacterized protein (AIM24 family)